MTAPARRMFVVALVCAPLLAMTAGCGANGRSAASVASSAGPSNMSVWRAATEALCRQKQTAIASLGAIHITYGGIARLGLPAVKRLLERYLTRLLAILQKFASRQRALPTPPALVSTIRAVRALDDQLQAATVRLRAALAGVSTAAGLSAVFRTWLVTLQHLSVRGEALARRLDVPACESQGPGTAAAG